MSTTELAAALAHIQSLMIAALQAGDETAYITLQAQQERLLDTK
jgi:hypothetical protein